MNLNSGSQSLKDVAEFTRQNEYKITTHYAKYANNPKMPLHDAHAFLHGGTGKVLYPICGYYTMINGKEECIYSEYSDETGHRYYYVKEPGKSIQDQYNEDRQSKMAPNDATNSQHSGGRIMSEGLTEISLDDLEKLRNALETFIENIKHECRKMESGVSFCETSMRDEASKKLLSRTAELVEDIRRCVEPPTLILEKIVDAIRILDDGYEV